MGKKIVEIIPCKDFYDRMEETEKAIKLGGIVEHIANNLIFVKYDNKRKH